MTTNEKTLSPAMQTLLASLAEVRKAPRRAAARKAAETRRANREAVPPYVVVVWNENGEESYRFTATSMHFAKTGANSAVKAGAPSASVYPADLIGPELYEAK